MSSNSIKNNRIKPKFGVDFYKDLDYLLYAIDKYTPNVDKSLIYSAFELCFKTYLGRIRKSGDAYYVHPLSVALIIIEELQIDDTAIIATALLHTYLRDNSDKDLLKKSTNEDIYNLVIKYYEVTDNTRIVNINVEKAYTIYQFFSAIVKDIRLFIILLCNRLHDIRTIEYLSEQEQIEVATETLLYYMPFVEKFGLYKIKGEIETLTSKYYSKYQNAENNSNRNNPISRHLNIVLQKIKNYLLGLSSKYNIEINRIPDYELYLSYQMGKRNNYDEFYALIIDVDMMSEVDVYNYLYDKINMDKNTHYFLSESSVTHDNSIICKLYTNMINIKILIKNRNYSSNDVFAKTTENKFKLTNFYLTPLEIESWENWILYVIERNDGKEATIKIWNSLQNNMFNDMIYVKSPKCEVTKLPLGATVIDYAFNKSNDIAMSLITCKINNEIREIFTQLKNDDVVELISSHKMHPDSHWLNHCISFKAVSELTKRFENIVDLPLSHKQHSYIDTYYNIVVVGNKNDLITKLYSLFADNIVRMTLATNSNNYCCKMQLSKYNIESNIGNIFLKISSIVGVKKIILKN